MQEYLYIYNNQQFETEQAVRNAIMKNERKAIPSTNHSDVIQFWKEHKVTVCKVEQTVTKEQLEQQIRTKRNQLLQQCDYYVINDYPSNPDDLNAVKAYRQALRDITKQTEYPFNVEWPTKPNCLLDNVTVLNNALPSKLIS